MSVSESNSNIAQRHDIVCRRGDTFSRTFHFKLNGVDEDITGSGFKCRVTRINDATRKAVLEFSEVVNGGITRPDNFRIKLEKTKTEMAAIIPGKYFYDVERTYPDDTVITWVEGFFTIVNDSTPTI
jgi:hypothetical protein